MDDASLTEKLRYMAKKTSGIDTGHCEDNIEAFKNVYELKKATDMQDTNLIFAVHCKELSNNGEPSYVFKISKYCLETAYKMDPTKMTVREKPSLLTSEPAYFMVCIVDAVGSKHLHCGHTIQGCGKCGV